MNRALPLTLLLGLSAAGCSAPRLLGPRIDRGVAGTLSRGLGWLLTQQEPDGSFGDHDSTALATLALLRAGTDPLSPAVRRATGYLLEARPQGAAGLGLSVQVFAKLLTRLPDGSKATSPIKQALLARLPRLSEQTDIEAVVALESALAAGAPVDRRALRRVRRARWLRLRPTDCYRRPAVWVAAVRALACPGHAARELVREAKREGTLDPDDRLGAETLRTLGLDPPRARALALAARVSGALEHPRLYERGKPLLAARPIALWTEALLLHQDPQRFSSRAGVNGALCRAQGPDGAWRTWPGRRSVRATANALLILTAEHERPRLEYVARWAATPAGLGRGVAGRPVPAGPAARGRTWSPPECW